jgi:hypothetical protein
VLATSCATPPLRLSPHFTVGEARTYRLRADASTIATLGDTTRRNNTHLEAKSTLEVLSISGDEATIKLTLTPTKLLQDGANATPPGAQEAELVVGPDGGVRRVTSVNRLPVSVVGGDLEDLAPVIGLALPTQRVRIGAPLPVPSTDSGSFTGRVSGVRVIDDLDCAILTIGRARPLTRQREIGGQQVSLEGTEYSTTTVAFAFKAGFPVDIDTTAEGHFSVPSGAVAGTTVTINSTTRLSYLPRG